MWDLSSPARDRIHVPCIGRQIVHHWITRWVPAVCSSAPLELCCQALSICHCIMSGSCGFEWAFVIFQQMLQNNRRWGGPRPPGPVQREPAWLCDLVGVPSPSVMLAVPSGKQDKDAFLPENSSVKFEEFSERELLWFRCSLVLLVLFLF